MEYVLDDAYDKPTHISYLEMATVAGGFDSIKLAIWGREGNYPHFHFYRGLDPNEGIPSKGKGGGCILFEEEKYFLHGSHKDSMDTREIRSLINFLNSKNELGHTVWKYMIYLWNTNNPQVVQVDLNTPIPEYYHNMPNVVVKTR